MKFYTIHTRPRPFLINVIIDLQVFTGTKEVNYGYHG